MSLSITPEVEQKIAAQLNSGYYKSANEVMLAALELLDQRDRLLSELRQQIEVGVEQINQGKVTDGEVIFDRLLNRLQLQFEE